MNNKLVYKLASVALYAVGFPILFAISLAQSIQWNSYDMYGIASFTPMFVTLGLWAVTWSLQFTIAHFCKKRNITGSGLMLQMVAVPVVAILGLFLVFDLVLPSQMDKGTSSTILYEDVVEDYKGQHDELFRCVAEFKRKNGLAESVKYTDKEFQDIFQPMFSSMDKAYNAFDKLAIEMALDQPDILQGVLSGKFPVSVAATLILKTADGNANDNNLALISLISLNLNKILTAVQELQDIGYDFTNTDKLNEIVNDVLVTKSYDGIEWNIFNILGENMLFPDIDPNAKIVANAGAANEKVMGAALSYQEMSWINGLPQMFFIPFMSIRNIAYAFAGIIAICAILQCTIESLYHKKFGSPMKLLEFNCKKAA